MKCPNCGGSNHGRNPKFRNPVPMGRYTVRGHICGDCQQSFISFERALTEDEMHKLADDLEQSDVA